MATDYLNQPPMHEPTGSSLFGFSDCVHCVLGCVVILLLFVLLPCHVAARATCDWVCQSERCGEDPRWKGLFENMLQLQCCFRLLSIIAVQFCSKNMLASVLILNQDQYRVGISEGNV